MSRKKKKKGNKQVQYENWASQKYAQKGGSEIVKL